MRSILVLLLPFLSALAPASPGTVSPASTLTPLKVDRNHSTIGFSVPIATGLSKVTGKFTDFDVEIEWDEEAPETSHVKATINVESVDTGIDMRDDDLRSDGFFDAAKYPEITFESTGVEKSGEQYLIHGTLAMHGVTHEVALPMELIEMPIPGTDRKWLSFNTSLVLDRTDYGIDWEHDTLAFFVGNDVTVEIAMLTSKPTESP